MQHTIWTLAADTEGRGLEVSVHDTELGAWFAVVDLLEQSDELEEHELDEFNRLLKAGDVAGLKSAIDRLYSRVGWLDTFTVQSHEITVGVAGLPVVG